MFWRNGRIKFQIWSAENKIKEAKSSAEVTKCRWRIWLKKFSRRLWRKLGLQLRENVFLRQFNNSIQPVCKGRADFWEISNEGLFGNLAMVDGDLDRKVGLAVWEDAQFGYRRWSYVQRTFANLGPKSSYWNSQTT